MKKNYLTSIFLFFVFSIVAQVPENINYQTLIRDKNGRFVANKSVSIRLSIIQGSPTGAIIYSEAHRSQTNDYGLINLKIGEGASTEIFGDINWAQALYIKVEAAIGSTGSYEEVGVSPFSSVPYALYAKSADIKLQPGEGINLNGKAINAKTNEPIWNASFIQGKPVSKNEPKIGDVLVFDGTHWNPGKQKVLPVGTGILSLNAKSPEGFAYSGNSIISKKTSGKWSTGSKMPNGRRFIASCEYNGKLYAFGGEDEMTYTTRHADVFNPLTNIWTSLTPMPEGRVLSAAVELNGLIYVAGGLFRSESMGSTRVDVYDPNTDSWSRHESMNVGRFAHSLFAYNNKLYAIGGTTYKSSTDVISTIEEYDFSTKKWSVIYTLPKFYHSTSSTMLNGAIYFVNGYNNANDYNTYSYNIATKEWSTHAKLNTPRANNAIGTIGKYLVVAGGRNLQRQALNCTELYSVQSDAWIQVNSTLEQSIFGLRGAEVNGKFVVAGGEIVNSMKTNATQVFSLEELEELIYFHQTK